MNTQTGEWTERRVRTKEMINKLLEERQEMLVLFCQVAGLEPYTPDKPVKEQLQSFCQVLMDYMAFGHFEIYQRITDGTERRTGILSLAQQVYPKIAEATEAAVTFNDKYDISDHFEPLDGLAKDLSSLGEELAQRIELEDQLVSAMLSR